MVFTNCLWVQVVHFLFTSTKCSMLSFYMKNASSLLISYLLSGLRVREVNLVFEVNLVSSTRSPRNAIKCYATVNRTICVFPISPGGPKWDDCGANEACQVPMARWCEYGVKTCPITPTHDHRHARLVQTISPKITSASFPTRSVV
jgi:hypothetical protein